MVEMCHCLYNQFGAPWMPLKTEKQKQAQLEDCQTGPLNEVMGKKKVKKSCSHVLLLCQKLPDKYV